MNPIKQVRRQELNRQSQKCPFIKTGMLDEPKKQHGMSQRNSTVKNGADSNEFLLEFCRLLQRQNL